ncbi:MAG TPA: 23S rRNA (uracil(1939)-C(5))-methyltransferase RlmD [Coxiellaceae bacterium]|nr:23S rRNA (uracil(1939)-C(5))-methyltransferase RlmD [Coxiellaceae bacterium]
MKTSLTAYIDNLSHEGRGVAHIEGKTTFIKGALPGEEVRFQYVRRKGSFDEGVLERVLESSPDRTTPPCPYFGVCGGCQHQHMSREAQLRHKEKVVLELLKYQGSIELSQLSPALIGPEWGYRRKARLSAKWVGGNKNKVLVGFREQNPRFIIDLDICLVLHPLVGQRLSLFSELFSHFENKTGIPQMEIAVAENAAAIIIRHLKPFRPEELEQLKQFAKTHSFQMYLQPNNADSIHPLWPIAPEPLYYTLPDFKLRFEFKPTQFTQINWDINRSMLTQALAWLDVQPNESVLDLFCGIGNISLPLARQALQVVGIEGEADAVLQAQHNAQLNQITHAEFYVANLFESVERYEWAKRSYDTVVLDPPRAGAKEIIPYFSRWKPKKVLYISCNPATFVRDAALLKEQGYTLTQAGIMDMFPHTHHIEVMVFFEHC